VKGFLKIAFKLLVYDKGKFAAFQQVADSLKALEHNAETQKAQLDSLQTSKESLKLINANYQSGLVNYLQVLIVNSRYQQAKVAYLQSLAQCFQEPVALFVALGGGWNAGN